MRGKRGKSMASHVKKKSCLARFVVASEMLHSPKHDRDHGRVTLVHS